MPPPWTLCMPTPHAAWGSTTCRTSSPVLAPDDLSAWGRRRAQGLQHAMPTSSLAIPPMHCPPASLQRRRPGKSKSPSLSFLCSKHPLSPSASMSPPASPSASSSIFRAGGLVPSHGYPASAYPQTPYQRQQVAEQRHARARPAGTNAGTRMRQEIPPSSRSVFARLGPQAVRCPCPCLLPLSRKDARQQSA
ncbi:hypothetical protein B0H13DRAFT_2340593 [Mycena leptocephala]|nr:hypothetical protein B0H13DRAFT_2340593 [Mycena leptocephala]